jgi:hypothetical protein
MDSYVPLSANDLFPKRGDRVASDPKSARGNISCRISESNIISISTDSGVAIFLWHDRNHGLEMRVRRSKGTFAAKIRPGPGGSSIGNILARWLSKNSNAPGIFNSQRGNETIQAQRRHRQRWRSYSFCRIKYFLTLNNLRPYCFAAIV